MPWPLDTGGRIRSFHLLRALARESDVRLVVAVRPGQEKTCARLGEHGLQVIPVSCHKRRPWREAWSAIRAAAAGKPYVMYRRHAISRVRDALAQAARQQQPDVLYLDHLDSHSYRHAAGPSQFAVMDLHNVYSMIARRFADEQRNPLKRAYLRRESALLQDVERRAAREVDLLFAVSAAEAQAYRAFGARSVGLVPNGVDCSRYEALPCGRATAGPNLLFLGTMSWGPNANAASFLIREVLPHVRRTHPDARLWVVGHSPPPEVAAFHDRDGVVVTGSVPDVVPYFRDARCMVVPLESGGGTRLKILEAFAAGLPVVSTPVGVEGIDAQDGVHLSVVDRADFATTILRLFADPGVADAHAREARRLVRSRYDWAGIGATAVDYIKTHLCAR